MNYRELAEKTEAYIISQRRRFHQHPELSWKEVYTTGAICQELAAMGYQVQRFPDSTGCQALLQGGKAGPGSLTVALRADIDALPVEEKTGLPFASEVPGVMHACGHDCHIAMLLGAAKMLMETRDLLPGTVKLLFQAAEESCHGAEYYIRQGVLEGVDAIFGQHIWGTLDAPFLNIQSGGRMASCDNFTIQVEGLSAHGTQPHLGVDALVAAASIVLNLQTLVSRNNDPVNPLVVTVGELHAGQRFNIIANHAELAGTVRTCDPSCRARMEAQIRHVAESTAAALGAAAKVEYAPSAGPLVNDDDDLTAIACGAAVKLYGTQGLKNLPMMMSSEDFAFYAEHIPAVFGFVGSRNPEKGLTAFNHNDCYTVDEAALKRGAALYAQFAFDFLSSTRH